MKSLCHLCSSLLVQQCT